MAKPGRAKKTLNAFGWFRLERYEKTKAMRFLDWHEQLSLRQTIAISIAPGLFTPRRIPATDEDINKATAAWQAIKSNPVATDLKLLEGTGWDLRSQSSIALDRQYGVRPLTYLDLRAILFSLELTVRGSRRTELLGFLKDPNSRFQYNSWMSSPVYRGLANPNLLGSVCVDLELPDKLLKKHFQSWLLTARDPWKAELRRVGGAAPLWVDAFAANGKHELTTNQLFKMRLLPCIDLLLGAEWAGVALSNNQLLMHLGKDGKASNEAVRVGVRKLASAIIGASEEAEAPLRVLRIRAAEEARQAATTNGKTKQT